MEVSRIQRIMHCTLFFELLLQHIFTFIIYFQFVCNGHLNYNLSWLFTFYVYIKSNDGNIFDSTNDFCKIISNLNYEVVL